MESEYITQDDNSFLEYSFIQDMQEPEETENLNESQYEELECSRLTENSEFKISLYEACDSLALTNLIQHNIKAIIDVKMKESARAQTLEWKTSEALSELNNLNREDQDLDNEMADLTCQMDIYENEKQQIQNDIEKVKTVIDLLVKNTGNLNKILNEQKQRKGEQVKLLSDQEKAYNEQKEIDVAEINILLKTISEKEKSFVDMKVNFQKSLDYENNIKNNLSKTIQENDEKIKKINEEYKKLIKKSETISKEVLNIKEETNKAKETFDSMDLNKKELVEKVELNKLNLHNKVIETEELIQLNNSNLLKLQEEVNKKFEMYEELQDKVHDIQLENQGLKEKLKHEEETNTLLKQNYVQIKKQLEDTKKTNDLKLEKLKEKNLQIQKKLFELINQNEKFIKLLQTKEKLMLECQINKIKADVQLEKEKSKKEQLTCAIKNEKSEIDYLKSENLLFENKLQDIMDGFNKKKRSIMDERSKQKEKFKENKSNLEEIKILHENKVKLIWDQCEMHKVESEKILKEIEERGMTRVNDIENTVKIRREEIIKLTEELDEVEKELKEVKDKKEELTKKKREVSKSCKSECQVTEDVATQIKTQGILKSPGKKSEIKRVTFEKSNSSSQSETELASPPIKQIKMSSDELFEKLKKD